MGCAALTPERRKRPVNPFLGLQDWVAKLRMSGKAISGERQVRDNCRGV
jgi:hypothetical protein